MAVRVRVPLAALFFKNNNHGLIQKMLLSADILGYCDYALLRNTQGLFQHRGTFLAH